jgi:hypothetical protein
MIIRLVKTVEIEVPTNDPDAAMDIVSEWDSEGSLEFDLDYYDAETDVLLN